MKKKKKVKAPIIQIDDKNKKDLKRFSFQNHIHPECSIMALETTAFNGELVTPAIYLVLKEAKEQQLLSFLEEQPKVNKQAKKIIKTCEIQMTD